MIHLLPVWMEANALEWSPSSLAHAAIAHIQMLDWMSVTIAAYILKARRDVELDKKYNRTIPDKLKNHAVLILIFHVLVRVVDEYAKSSCVTSFYFIVLLQVFDNK